MSRSCQPHAVCSQTMGICFCRCPWRASGQAVPGHGKSASLGQPADQRPNAPLEQQASRAGHRRGATAQQPAFVDIAKATGGELPAARLQGGI